MPPANSNRQKLTQLRKLLIQHFSLDELRVLCFDLGLEYEELPGNTRTTKMHGLIEYLQRRGELAILLAEVIELRPLINWPVLSNPTSTPVNSFLHKKSGLEMIHIPAGEFLYTEEKQPIFLPSYWIASTSNY